LAFRVDREEGTDHAVVIAAGELAARFEPAASGTAHFTLKEGTRVRITRRREGWVQAQRCDGRRGWVPTEAVMEIGGEVLLPAAEPVSKSPAPAALMPSAGGRHQPFGKGAHT
ncbi:MAG TPA: SH3 domain-containing protein, partial [Terriglobales bacterium]|nr:SH3 domain-containing protein [Terriglobales bacterium]